MRSTKAMVTTAVTLTTANATCSSIAIVPAGGRRRCQNSKLKTGRAGGGEVASYLAMKLAAGEPETTLAGRLASRRVACNATCYISTQSIYPYREVDAMEEISFF
jgi:hypothetical protein